MEIFDCFFKKIYYYFIFYSRATNQKKMILSLQVNLFFDLYWVFFGRGKSCILQLHLIYVASTLGVSVPRHRGWAFGCESLAGRDESEFRFGWGEDMECIFLNNFSKQVREKERCLTWLFRLFLQCLCSGIQLEWKLLKNFAICICATWSPV